MDFSIYQSPFSWRYGSDEMRQIWSEKNKRRLWRRIWVVLAEAQSEYGLVTEAQVHDLRSQVENIDLERAFEFESEIHHDLMAEIKTFAEQCPVGAGIIHMGATSMDIEDNADALRLRQSLHLIITQLAQLILSLFEFIQKFADTPTIGYTHIQPAEPTTLGYRFASYAQDFLADWEALEFIYKNIKGKGFRGAVGTSAAYSDLIGYANLPAFDLKLSQKLGLVFFPITTQTYPRKQDYQILSALAGVGASIYKFAFDLRILQSPPFGEWSEPFKAKQVGSSAMPFKRNPIQSEKLDSLGRYLAQLPRIAWDNAAHSLLERTLDDSANRRSLLPEAFLITDEMVNVATRIIQGIVVDPVAIQKNLNTYGPFAATERILMAGVKKGADRQILHEHLRVLSMQAWEAIRKDDENPLIDLVSQHPQFQMLFSKTELNQLFDFTAHTGDATKRALEITQSGKKVSAWLEKGF